MNCNLLFGIGLLGGPPIRASAHHSRRLAPLLAAAGLACASPPAELPSVDARPPAFQSRQVVFTRPDARGQGSHIGKLKELLAHAAPGSEVTAAVFLFDHEGLMKAFGKARRRGVKVEVVASRVSEESEARLRKRLEAPGEPERVFVFPGGHGRKNHNKFVVFSELRYAGESIRDVVFLSSGNFTEASLHKHQNTLVLVDAGLSRAYRSYWADLVEAGLERRKRPDYYRTADGDDTTTRVHFFPRSEGDTVLEALAGIAPEGDGSIRVAMARWRKSRMDIADRLCELQEGGLDVQIVTRRPSRFKDSGVDPEVVQRLRDCRVGLLELPKSRANLHSKYMLVDAAVRGDGAAERRRIVWTGSPNFTGAALRRNDEALLQIEDPQLFARYRGNFDELVRAARAFR